MVDIAHPMCKGGLVVLSTSGFESSVDPDNAKVIRQLCQARRGLKLTGHEKFLIMQKNR